MIITQEAISINLDNFLLNCFLVIKEVCQRPPKDLLKFEEKVEIQKELLYVLLDYFIILDEKNIFIKCFDQIIHYSENSTISYKFYILLKKFCLKYFNQIESLKDNSNNSNSYLNRKFQTIQTKANNMFNYPPNFLAYEKGNYIIRNNQVPLGNSIGINNQNNNNFVNQMNDQLIINQKFLINNNTSNINNKVHNDLIMPLHNKGFFLSKEPNENHLFYNSNEKNSRSENTNKNALNKKNEEKVFDFFSTNEVLEKEDIRNINKIDHSKLKAINEKINKIVTGEHENKEFIERIEKIDEIFNEEIISEVENKDYDNNINNIIQNKNEINMKDKHLYFEDSESADVVFIKDYQNNKKQLINIAENINNSNNINNKHNLGKPNIINNNENVDSKSKRNSPDNIRRNNFEFTNQNHLNSNNSFQNQNQQKNFANQITNNSTLTINGNSFKIFL